MANQELIRIFSEIAIFLKMEEIPFKPKAYEKAVLGLETLVRDVKEIYEREGTDGLKEIPGVGKNIAEKIKEYLKTGKVKSYEKLKRKMPVSLEELIAVEGIGPKMIKDLWFKLKIKNLKDLEKAPRANQNFLGNSYFS